jgi:thiol:disulfide interchange protein DsbD
MRLRMRTRRLLALIWIAQGALALTAPAARAAWPDGPAGSQGAGAYQDGEARVHAHLLVDAPQDGGAWRAGVLLESAPGWYLYWRHPGDTGLATQLELSQRGAPLALEWPVPEAFQEDDLVSYGYAGEVLLAAKVDPAQPGLPVHARADVLVCNSQCLPAKFELSRPLAAETDLSARAAVHALFEATAARVPKPAAERGVALEAEFTRVPRAEGEPLEARIRITRCGDVGDCAAAAPPADAAPLFIYEPAPWVVHAAPGELHDGSLSIALTGVALPGSEAEPAALRGVLALRAADGSPQPVEFNVPLPARGAQASAASIAPEAAGAAASSAGALWKALVFGFIGGLVLNLMPCVLPVLVLKLAALAELSQRSRREVWHHAGAYTAGIQASLLALALCVLALRASGRAVGWGFQLQEPLFVALIAVVLVTFATNLFGAFELEFAPDRLARVGENASGAARSFFDGLLAVALATPCSAPFLGTAVGFAFASGAPVCVAIFAAIGLGLAAPFVAVSLSPGLARALPRGGTWMLELRRGLAFALLLTAAWLLWVTARQSGADAALGLLILLLCVAIAGWLFGVAQRARGRLGAPILIAVVAAIALVGEGRIDWTPRSAEAHDDAAPYARAALEATLDAGRPAFVYFTADWCLTCKLNERRVLDTEPAQQELARLGFAVFRADWTLRDAAIASELARLGRAGVPVYALYAVGRPDSPRLLPDLLSLDAFTAALRETASAAETHHASREEAAAPLP